jgi:predicted MFS family arabinose efflux permease
VAVLSIASGLAQFSVTTVIGDVAAHFGEQTSGEDVASQLGMPATTIGLSLAIIRLSSLAALPATAMADRMGRRRLLLTAITVGLGLTALAAMSPSYWIYVALVAMARPALTTLNALAGVVAAEEATSVDRSSAIALIAVAYGLGAGVVSVGRGLLPGEPSFRVVTAFVLLPLVLLPLLARRIREPRIADESARATGLPGMVPAGLRGRVAVLALMAGIISIATGPGFTYLFVYGEGVLDASPGQLSLLVLAAGPAGLAGVLVGRFGADRLGRRVTAGAGMALTGGALVVAYGGDVVMLSVGYLGAVAASTAFGPPEGALSAELVPTSVRATVAGWITVTGVLGAVLGLAVFGIIADATGSFATASRWIGIGVALSSLGFTLLPETRGMELDEDVPPRRRAAPDGADDATA